MKRLATGITFVFILLACGPRYDGGTSFQKEKRYNHPASLRSPLALFVRERGGAPSVMASAFLIDKNKGLFASAKHFVGTDADGDCKIFFNGRVYEGALVLLPPTTDIAIIKITDQFNSTDFPEPYLRAKVVKKDDKIFIRGIHPHPKQFQKGRTLIPIFREYYGISWRPDEFVSDNLEGRVVSLTKEMKNKEMGVKVEITAGISNTYYELKTNEDHRFSFGGLSGGPTVNEGGELVGINSNESQAHWEVDIKDRKAVYHPWDNMNIVPVAELNRLQP